MYLLSGGDRTAPEFPNLAQEDSTIERRIKRYRKLARLDGVQEV